VKPERILVDTSAWIVSFKKAGNPGLQEFLKNSVVAGFAATCPLIILELLQGCRTEKERDSLKIKLESLEVLPITPAIWERAYELAFSLRRKGQTTPTTDLIIAAIAMEENCILLHQDQHYEQIAQYNSRLRTRSF